MAGPNSMTARMDDPPQPDGDATIAGALQADIRMHAGFRKRVDEQERKIVKRVVLEYRNGSLTDEKLWGFVGEIVGVRDLLSTLVTDMRVAEAALKED